MIVLLSTDPSPCWCVVLLLAKNGVEDEKEDKSKVVGYDSLRTGELSIIDHVKPGGKEKDPWNAVEQSLQQ